MALTQVGFGRTLNMGDKPGNIREALRLLGEREVALIRHRALAHLSHTPVGRR